ncbi:MAG: circularly permuted type 2 ATP-grasp protein, partial [Puniceicoccales bacterium]
AGGFYDEWMSAQGRIAEHWNKFFGNLAEAGEQDYRQREDQLERIIAENGITYNVYSEPENLNRLWKMDAIPLLLEQAAYERIAAAQAQRLALLNLILEDIYGPQNLLRRGLYPTGLVFGNPAFLRPVHGLLRPGRRFLSNHSSDLARSPDGNWWFLTDRLDAASGLGYSVENRVISTRVMPDLMRRHNVKRLATYIEAFSDSLKRACPRSLENPFVVLLTPGPYNETYFEQSYLARALGFPLVEGADLTVRDDQVFLKTIHGMKRVDVIFRRLDSEWCDPLEFRHDSLLGVPGLVNAIRKDTVAVVNAPGVGVLETPALAAFLPTICRELLGEELLMPSVATWWCGQPHERQYVLENVEHLVIKPTFPSKDGRKTWFGPTMSKAEREQLIARINSHPELYTAQETVLQATTPVYDKDKLSPRHFILRTFLTSDGEDAPLMMPGGLCRVARSAVSGNVSMQVGGVSKDVWVISESDASADEALAYHFLTNKFYASDVRIPLSSRMADSLFWVGRYLDRAEGMVRGLLVIINAFQESRNEADLKQVLHFIRSFAPNLIFENVLSACGPNAETSDLIDESLRQLTRGPTYPDRLELVLTQLNRVMFSVKEMMSGDLTRMLRDMPTSAIIREGKGSVLRDGAFYSVLKRLLDYMAAFAGIIAENTVRGHDWIFLNLGRRIERSLMLTDLLRGCFASPLGYEDFLLLRLLEFSDSAVTYRRRFLSRMRIEAVCQLIITDPSNPRSLAFQVSDILDSTRRLPHYDPSNLRAIDRLALRIYSDTILVEPMPLVAAKDDGKRPGLSAFLRQTGHGLGELSDELSSYYFSVTSRK